MLLFIILVEIPVAILTLPFTLIRYKRTGQLKFYTPLSIFDFSEDQENQYTPDELEVGYDINYFEWTDKLSETAVEAMFPKKTLIDLAKEEFDSYKSRFDSAEDDAKTDSPKADAKTDSPKADAKKDSPKADTKTDSPQADAKTDSPQADTKTDSPQADASTDSPKNDVGADSPKAEMKPRQITIPQQTIEPVGLNEEKNSSRNQTRKILKMKPEPLKEQDISDVDIKELNRIELIDLDNPSSVVVAYGDYRCVVCQENICCDKKLGPFCYVRRLSCGHVFHESCIFDWLTKSKASCPICNQAFYSVPTS